MAAQSVGFLQQADLTPGLGRIVWDTSGIVPDSSWTARVLQVLVGYTDRPTQLQLVVYLTTLGSILFLMRVLAPAPRRERRLSPIEGRPGIASSRRLRFRDSIAHRPVRRHRSGARTLESIASRAFLLHEWGVARLAISSVPGGATRGVGHSHDPHASRLPRRTSVTGRPALDHDSRLLRIPSRWVIPALRARSPAG